jgi:hypothetical protein
MTHEQILEKLDKVETAIFMNEMIDHWTWFDREERARLEKEKRELLAMLKG